MFPTTQDCEAFRSEFGPEGVIHRMEIPPRGGWGAQGAAVVMAAETKEDTLERAWALARSLAHWTLARVGSLTPTERCIVIVGWSKSVRPLQGQIFKMGGTLDMLARLAACEDWKTVQGTTGQRVLLARWE